MTLLAFAAEHRRLLSGRSAANPPQAAAAVDRWDRQTGGRTDARRFIDPAPHTIWAVSISRYLTRIDYSA